MIGFFYLFLGWAAPAEMPPSVPADIAWVSEGEYCEPETVLPLPDDTLLVSNVCDFRAAGTGFLTRLGGDGEMLAWQAVADLDAPTGMALAGDRLYVVDTNRIRVLSWPDFAPLEVIILETQVANDLAADEAGNLYVTDTAAGEVVHVAPSGRQSVLAGEARFPDANGIALLGRHLLVGGERLWRVDLASGAVAAVGPSWLTDIDGIEVEADGTVQVTPVGGPLVRLRPDGEVEIYADQRISSANHGFAERLGLALIPTGFDNTVVAVRIPRTAY